MNAEEHYPGFMEELIALLNKHNVTPGDFVGFAVEMMADICVEKTDAPYEALKRTRMALTYVVDEKIKEKEGIMK
jgi:hypothetical protein